MIEYEDAPSSDPVDPYPVKLEADYQATSLSSAMEQWLSRQVVMPLRVNGVGNINVITQPDGSQPPPVVSLQKPQVESSDDPMRINWEDELPRAA